MCGIVGQLKTNKQIDPEEFHAMRETLFHRGPDGAGTKFLQQNHIALGHRRLSIIDLSQHGKQPMCNEDGTLWLTFNGEIYNFQGIRQVLVQLGHKFKSKTDSEVLIHGYEEWGIRQLLSRIKGMFAFALWDDANKKLIAARDRFGMKPFYYYKDRDQLIFASEIKAITNASDVIQELDHEALADFFIYSYVPNPRSIWKHVSKLPPAHYLEHDFQSHQTVLQEYWTPGISDRLLSDTEAVEQANHLIKSATSEHMVSDVPVGLFLSGGYDSATLLMHMTDLGYDVSSYSIGFENSDRSEHRQAQIISDTFHSKHHENILGEEDDPLSVVEDITRYYDEPFAVSSMIPYYHVSKLAAQHGKVALAGDGGDEVFAGYRWHYFIHDYDKKPNINKWIRQLIYGKEAQYLKLYDKWMTGTYELTKKRKFLDQELQSSIQNRGLYLYEQFNQPQLDPVKAFQFLDYKTFIAEPCLTRADRSSMAHSLEVRVPFLDHEILEFVFSLSTGVYFKEGVKKHLLKKNL